jgi:glycerate-2-kinase
LIHVYADGTKWNFQTTLRDANQYYQLYEIVVPLDCLKALAKAQDSEMKPDDSFPITFTCSLKAYAAAYLAYVANLPTSP